MVDPMIWNHPYWFLLTIWKPVVLSYFAARKLGSKLPIIAKLISFFSCNFLYTL